MAFEDGEPTFRLVFGTPGESHALDLARRLELDAEWVDRASELLGSERVSLAQLMTDLEEERRLLRRERARLEQLSEETAAGREQVEEEKEALVEQRRELSVSLQRRQDQFERRALKRIDAGLERLERDLEEKDDEARVDRAERGRVLKEALADRPHVEAPATEERAWQEGDRVRHRVLSWSGTVVATRDEQVQVAAGGKKIWVRGGELEPAEEKPQPGVTTSRGSSLETPSESELKLLGFRVDDALEALDDFLLRTHADGADRVRVIHGHGTGRLRRAVRQFVGKHRLVASSASAPQSEGGNGATIVELVDG